MNGSAVVTETTMQTALLALRSEIMAYFLGKSDFLPAKDHTHKYTPNLPTSSHCLIQSQSGLRQGPDVTVRVSLAQAGSALGSATLQAPPRFALQPIEAYVVSVVVALTNCLVPPINKPSHRSLLVHSPAISPSR